MHSAHPTQDLVSLICYCLSNNFIDRVTGFVKVLDGFHRDARACDAPGIVNNVPVSTLDALRGAVDRLKVTDPLVIQVERSGKLMYLTLSD